jgi:mycothiol synthase
VENAGPVRNESAPVSVEVVPAPLPAPAYAAIASARCAEEPAAAVTADSLRRDDEGLIARGAAPVWQVARRGDGVVGYGRVFDAGAAYLANVWVAPRERRRGIGSAIWRAAEDELRRLGASAVRTVWLDAAADAALGFLRHHAFRERDRAWELVLDLTASPASGARAPRGISITTLLDEGPGDHAVRRRVWELHNASRRDQPPADEHADPIPFDAWVSRMVDGPEVPPDGFFLAKEGDAYVGMTTLERGQAPSDGLRNGFTGVLPEHRGRGIARALKLAAIAHARARGYRLLATGQHADNAAMLRVNERLGYRRASTRVRYEKELG